jgi:polyisoprenoid-binding protein YceI
MRRPSGIHTVVIGGAVAIAAYAASGVIVRAQPPLAIDAARITISGTSNIHPYTASTSTVRVTRSQLAGAVAGPQFWTEVLKPGAVEAFEIAVPAATLTSPREGLDKNMHKALNVQEHPDITFRLLRFEPTAAGAVKALGILRIAAVEREVALDLQTQRSASGLAVKGELQLLMTDYGIKPPTAMLGMLKTDPKVTVTFETVLTIPLT